MAYLSMENKDFIPIESTLSNKELLDEIALLREKLNALQKSRRTDQEKLTLLSKELKIGCWEWDEVENRSIIQRNIPKYLDSVLNRSMRNTQVSTILVKAFILTIYPNSIKIWS